MPTDSSSDTQEVRLEVHKQKLEALKHRVRVLCPGINAQELTSAAAALEVLQERGTEPVGFLQFFNIWRCMPLIVESVSFAVLAFTQVAGRKMP